MKSILKLLLLIPSIILAIVVALNISIVLKSGSYDEYNVKISSDSFIEKVIVNNTEMPLERYLSDSSKIITKEVLEDNEYKEKKYLTSDTRSEVNIMLSCIDDIYIGFEGEIKLFLNGEEIELKDNYYDRSIGIIQVIKMSVNYYTLIFVILIIPICYLIVVYISYFLNKLKNENVKLWQILLFVFSIYILYLFAFYFLMYSIRKFAIILIVAFGGVYIYYLKDTLETNIEKSYLVLATLIGLTIMFLIPPFNIPDEGAHFIKSFEYTLDETDEYARCILPESISNFRYKYEHGSYEYNSNYNFKSYFVDLFDSGNYSVLNDKIENYGNTINLPVIAYIPTILLFKVLRLLEVSPFILFMSGRFINLLIMIVICYYSIRNLPRFKKIIFVVTLLPIFLHQGMGINQDWLTNSMAICIVTYIIKLKYQYDKVELKNIGILSLMAIIIALCKFGYFFVLLLVWIIPNDKFDNKKVAIAFKLMVILIPLLVAIMQNNGTISIATSDETVYYTFESALKNPFNVIQIFFRTLSERGTLDFFTGFFDGYGISTKWLSTMSNFIITSIYLILILSSKDDNEGRIKLSDRSCILVVGLIIIVVIYCSLFFTWTKEGAKTVSGLQPRYFLVPALLVYMSTYNDVFKINLKNKSLFYSLAILVVHCIVALSLTSAFY